MSNRVKLATALMFLAGLPVLAVSTKFSNFSPLTTSALPLPIDGTEEATPITLADPKWSQRTVADRRTQNELVPGSNSGNWDMITSNATGPDAGRYLFMPFETGTAGVQRVDLQNPHYDKRTVTIVAPGTQAFVAGDASRWTPWGGYLTAEESWGANSTKGRLFEVKNPITAGLNGGDFIWRMILPRVSHEGLVFDKDNAMYFVDELNGGTIYKYVSVHPDAATGDEYFSAGQSFALRVGAGGQFEGSNGPAITGAATWVAITNAMGGPLAGVSTALPDGTIDGRVAADDNDVRSTGYNRPEDMEIQTLANGTQLCTSPRPIRTSTTTEAPGPAGPTCSICRLSKSSCSRRPSRLIRQPAMRSAADCETRTTSRLTTRATSTSSRTATAGWTTTSGSPSI